VIGTRPLSVAQHADGGFRSTSQRVLESEKPEAGDVMAMLDGNAGPAQGWAQRMIKATPLPPMASLAPCVTEAPTKIQ
jgi:hypothetical protein